MGRKVGRRQSDELESYINKPLLRQHIHVLEDIIVEWRQLKLAHRHSAIWVGGW